jgi:hypothetical protein
VPPLGLPQRGPVANCPTTTPIVRPSHPRTVKPSTPSLLVGASSATWHHTISTTMTRCAAVSYAAVVEYEDVVYASLGESKQKRALFWSDWRRLCQDGPGHQAVEHEPSEHHRTRACLRLPSCCDVDCPHCGRPTLVSFLLCYGCRASSARCSWRHLNSSACPRCPRAVVSVHPQPSREGAPAGTRCVQ